MHRISPCPYKPGIPVTGEEFCNRESVIEQITTNDNRYSLYAVVGGKGMGKSSALKESKNFLQQKLKSEIEDENGQPLIPIFVDIPYMDDYLSDDEKLLRCMENIVAGIDSGLKRVSGILDWPRFTFQYRTKTTNADNLSVRISGEIEENFYSDLTNLIIWCNGMPNNPRVVLFLDRFCRLIDESENIRKRLASLLYYILQPELKLGVTNQVYGKISLVIAVPMDLHEILPIDESWYLRDVEVISLEVLSKDDSCDLIRKSFGNKNDNHQKTIDTVYQWIGGHPLLIHVFMESIYKQSMFTNLTDDYCCDRSESIMRDNQNIWGRVLDEETSIVFEYLSFQDAAVTIADLQVMIPNILCTDIGSAIKKLKYCGLIEQRQEKPTRYMVSARFFRKSLFLQINHINQKWSDLTMDNESITKTIVQLEKLAHVTSDEKFIERYGTGAENVKNSIREILSDLISIKGEINRISKDATLGARADRQDILNLQKRAHLNIIDFTYDIEPNLVKFIQENASSLSERQVLLEHE